MIEAAATLTKEVVQTTLDDKKGDQGLNWKDILMISAIALSALAAIVYFIIGGYVSASIFSVLCVASCFGEYFVRKYNEIKDLPQITTELKQNVTDLKKEVNSLIEVKEGYEKTLHHFRTNCRELYAEYEEICDKLKTTNKELNKTSALLEANTERLDDVTQSIRTEQARLVEIRESITRILQQREQLFLHAVASISGDRQELPASRVSHFRLPPASYPSITG